MRITRIGLALVAVLALGAITAGSAFALPEYGRCVEKAGTGKYKDSNCTQKAGSKAEEKKYEFVKTIEKKGFTSLGTTPGVLQTVGGSEVRCTGETANGEYVVTTSTKAVKNVVVKFTGCELPLLGVKCNTSGAGTGEITTNTLEGKLAYISKTSKTVEQELKPAKTAPGKLFVKFECGGGAVVIEVGQGTGKGGDCIYGPITPTNTMQTSATQTYSGSAGVQNPNKLEGSTKTCNLESRANGGAWERATQSITTTITGEEAAEIKA